MAYLALDFAGFFLDGVFCAGNQGKKEVIYHFFLPF
jgi:hypothetical protein